MTLLLPCPFCGGDKIVSGHIRDGRSIRCVGCGAATHAFEPDAEGVARTKWNARVSADGNAAGNHPADKKGETHAH